MDGLGAIMRGILYISFRLILTAVKSSVLLLRRSNEHLKFSHDGGETSALMKVNSPVHEDFPCALFPNML